MNTKELIKSFEGKNKKEIIKLVVAEKKELEKEKNNEDIVC